MKLSDEQISNIIEEIGGTEEVGRRALSKRRHDIYRDGGRAFLIEQIIREFGKDALKEMRLAPVNLLKKIINKRSQVYRKAPTRVSLLESDQPLVDYYTKALDLNVVMQKANRYYTLQSNEALYTRPVIGDDGYYKLKSDVVPPFLYSIKSNAADNTKVETYVFNQFTEEGQVAPQENVPSATGAANFNQERGYKSSDDQIESNEKVSDTEKRAYIFWSDEEHFTTNEDGVKFRNPLQDDSQFVNPIGIKPIVNIAKERDNESWATQGEDLIDMTIALQLGFTDVLTIAKHQGFGQLVISGEDEPKTLTLGINKAVWLKTTPAGAATSMEYLQANSPLDAYRNLLMELLGILLSTNDLEPGSISGSAQAQSFTSGFHQLIAMSDNLMAVEADKPVFEKAEHEHWKIISRWHNQLADAQVLPPELAQLGKFSDQFKISVSFSDVSPIESEDDIIRRIKDLRSLKLLSRMDALKRLYPTMTNEQAEIKLQEIDAEVMGAEPVAQPDVNEVAEEELEEENGDKG